MTIVFKLENLFLNCPKNSKPTLLLVCKQYKVHFN